MAIPGADDFDLPSQPNEYASAFFAADYRNDPSQAYVNWIEPGTYYWCLNNRRDGSGDVVDQAVIDAALSQWQGMTQTNRYRIRLHHESLVKLPHDTLDKVFVYYHTGIPLSARENIRESLTDEFRFLGLTFQAAKNTLNGIASGLANHFWPGWVARLVVYGHESDFS